MFFDEHSSRGQQLTQSDIQRDLMRDQDKYVRPAVYAGTFGGVLGSIGAGVLHIPILIGAIAGFVVLAALVLIEPGDRGPTSRR